MEILEASDPHEQAAFVTAAACTAAGLGPRAHPGPARRTSNGRCAAAVPQRVHACVPSCGPGGAGDGPSVAILYRQRSSGRAFQELLRVCGVPFNRCATPPLLTRGMRDAAAAMTLAAFQHCTGFLPAGLERPRRRRSGGVPLALAMQTVPQQPCGSTVRERGPGQGDAGGHRMHGHSASACVSVACDGATGLPWKRGSEPEWLRRVAGRTGVPHTLASAGLRLFRAFLEEEACMKRADGGLGSEVCCPRLCALSWTSPPSWRCCGEWPSGFGMPCGGSIEVHCNGTREYPLCL